ncbi:MAG: hypothetical protein KGI57_10105 [Hyphomicrobiales bacterium]|nr:hypothetical protein [Hyphomicrobiales bacterium]MDE2018049.1 hypothetical protein [Hyphomicrobiales bacterium]
MTNKFSPGVCERAVRMVLDHEAADNNPLRFTPHVDDALRIMFGPRGSSYLDARRVFGPSFDDVKTHQLKVFSAMQSAMLAMLGELDPAKVEEAAGGGVFLGSRKARLRELYVAT